MGDADSLQDDPLILLSLPELVEDENCPQEQDAGEQEEQGEQGEAKEGEQEQEEQGEELEGQPHCSTGQILQSSKVMYSGVYTRTCVLYDTLSS